WCVSTHSDSMEIRCLPVFFILFLGVSTAVSKDALVNEYFDKTIIDEETALSQSDFDLARLRIRAKREAGLNDAQEEIDDSSMYNADRFEGDIANNGLTSKTVRGFVGDEPVVSTPGVMRNAVRQSYLKWPSGRIPYTISTQYSSISRQRIAEAIDDYSANTCIKFEPKGARDSDYVHITPDDGCYSLVGKNGGRQVLSLGDGCIQKGIIVHELMHTVGFFHEQSRADRDDYVTINWMNVENGLQDQFDKYSLTMIDHLGTAYDYGSIMHYAKTAFSKNGKPTITPKKDGVTIGQRRGFSTNDLYKINKLYACPASTQGGPPSSSSASSMTTTTPSPRTQVLSKCKDKRSDCLFLARNGHCDSTFSSRFMLNNCPASCRACDDSSSEVCADARSWCGRWASTGMCSSPIFNDYMSANCRASCGFC
ncbi:hypothetical protein PFISCL1PPCAC_27849, partial [Pristionchus fissidentatus]